MLNEKEKEISCRCWELAFDIEDSKTGKVFFNPYEIENILRELPYVVSFAWVLHINKEMTPHVHIVAKFSRAVTLLSFISCFNLAGKAGFFAAISDKCGRRDVYVEHIEYLIHGCTDDEFRVWRLGNHYEGEFSFDKEREDEEYSLWDL